MTYANILTISINDDKMTNEEPKLLTTTQCK